MYIYIYNDISYKPYNIPSLKMKHNTKQPRQQGQLPSILDVLPPESRRPSTAVPDAAGVRRRPNARPVKILARKRWSMDLAIFWDHLFIARLFVWISLDHFLLLLVWIQFLELTTQPVLEESCPFTFLSVVPSFGMCFKKYQFVCSGLCV